MSKQPPQQVLGYTRVSTDEQASSGLGLEAQRGAIEAECRRRGWDLVEVVSDAGVSGKSMARRRGLSRVLRSLKAGEADALVVAKLDRLSRSLLDFSTLMETARRQGWAIVTLDLGVDTTTPAGEMLANVLATFSQFERRLIGQRTKEALAVLKGQGVKLGRPPEVPEEVARRIATERRQGKALQAIADGLNADGVPTVRGGTKWYSATIHRVLGWANEDVA